MRSSSVERCGGRKQVGWRESAGPRGMVLYLWRRGIGRSILRAVPEHRSAAEKPMEFHGGRTSKLQAASPSAAVMLSYEQHRDLEEASSPSSLPASSSSSSSSSNSTPESVSVSVSASSRKWAERIRHGGPTAVSLSLFLACATLCSAPFETSLRRGSGTIARMGAPVH